MNHRLNEYDNENQLLKDKLIVVQKEFTGMCQSMSKQNENEINAIKQQLIDVIIKHIISRKTTK